MSQELPSNEELEKINRYEMEAERVQKTLGNFLDRESARKVAGRIYDMALDIDESIDTLLADPEVIKKYKYDGEFFEPKIGIGFFKALNGFGFLKKAASNQNIEVFFRHHRGPIKTIGHMLWWLRSNVWLAKARLRNWKKRGDMGLISREELDRRLEDLKSDDKQSEGGAPPLSTGEQEFFRLYEEEMGLPEGGVDEWLRKKIKDSGQS